MSAAAEPHVEPQFQDLANAHAAARFGMWVFIGSEVLFFAALGALYFGYRATFPAEFASASHHSKLILGTANTYVLLTSSLFVALAVHSIRHDRARMSALHLVIASALACVFLGLKATEYLSHFREGIYPGAAYAFAKEPGDGARHYFTMYYVMTGLHALHVVVGLALFAWAVWRLLRGRYSARAHLGVELVGIYWHFVDVVWLFLWPMFYLLH